MSAPVARPGVRVYKVGGPALEDPDLVAPLAAEIRRSGGRALLVHGGGRHVERVLGALAIESRFVEGRRETSEAAMSVVEMVLSGSVNKALASGLTAAGLSAVGLSGRDAGLLTAAPVPGLGRVGRPAAAATRLLATLWDAGFVPVVSPVAAGPSGEALNVNADEAALGLALALCATSLVYLSDVDGVRVAGGTVRSLDAGEVEPLLADGSLGGGMALKVRTALEAARAGIPEVVIAGRARLTGGFQGTRIGPDAREEVAG